jgi:glycosyltransferase involved in cell wall biosynthesis
MSSSETRKEISDSQRQRILEHYPWEHIAARYADVYRETLGVVQEESLSVTSRRRA